jgi:xylose isomerase
VKNAFSCSETRALFGRSDVPIIKFSNREDDRLVAIVLCWCCRESSSDEKQEPHQPLSSFSQATFETASRTSAALRYRPTMPEFFPDVPAIPYKGPSSTDPLSFRYYNPDEIILNKTMKEWLRFAVCFWHTMMGSGQDPFGSKTLRREWEEDLSGLELAKRRIDVAFELFVKLGVPYYTFHDFDVVPEGATIEESNRNLDIISDYLLQKQQETGVKLLWCTQNLFSHPRYMHGGLTSPDVHVFCCAAAQIQKALDINHKLGGLSHVFWGGPRGLSESAQYRHQT